MTTQYVRTSVDLPVEEHRRLKVYTALSGISLKDYLYNCIHDHTPYVPNAETLATMKATNDYIEAKRRGEAYKPENPDHEIVECKDLEDFFKKARNLMKEIKYTNTFKKQLKKQQARQRDIEKFKDLATKLANGIILDEKHRNHKLIGEYKGLWECHIEPDWLLIYYMDSETIICERTGTHSDLF